MSEYIKIDTPDGSFSAYLARPATAAAPAPAIVVIQEIFGVNADLRATCDELAALGFLAVSPDLFWRLKPGVDLSPQSEADWKKALEFYKTFDYAVGVNDIAATIETARLLRDASGKVGLLGFCFGGLMTFLTTARKGADASVVYYGGGTDAHLDEAGNIRNPLMIHLGEEDEYISKDAQKAIIGALKDNADVQVFTYPGQAHAFARHGGAHYDRTAATLANERTAGFFAMHLNPARSAHASSVM